MFWLPGRCVCSWCRLCWTGHRQCHRLWHYWAFRDINVEAAFSFPIFLDWIFSVAYNFLSPVAHLFSRINIYTYKEKLKYLLFEGEPVSHRNIMIKVILYIWQTLELPEVMEENDGVGAALSPAVAIVLALGVSDNL